MSEINEQSPAETSRSVPVDGGEAVRLVFGDRDCHRRRIREALDVEIVHRGESLRLFGRPDAVERCDAVMTALIDIAGRTGRVGDDDVEKLLREKSPAAAPATALPPAAHAATATRPAVPLAPSPAAVPIGRPAWRQVDLQERGKSVAALTAGQDAYLRAIESHDLVFGTGPAGSGKTFLAVAAAVAAVRRAEVRKIVLARPAVEAGEKLGFLPGDMREKVDPYFRPLIDALGEMVAPDQLQEYLKNDLIEVVPLAFMRGRTLSRTFIILDEAQNSTATQMKMFLTRMGQGSKIVVTGDATQNDLPHGVTSGLNDAVSRLSGVAGVAVVKLERADIVRHPLVREIVRAYDAQAEGNFPAAGTASAEP